MIVRRIAPQRELRKLRVAAYARVSTALVEQVESFETQVDYYTRLIEQNTNWEFAGIYADAHHSGTSAKHRPEFQRMIADAEAGKIDVIMVKSISRFARNVVDAQRYVHQLKEHNVEVRFEKEAISSTDPASEMMFNILAAIAQEESRNRSEQVKWGYRKRAEQGIRRIGNNRVLGYDEVDGVLTPNQDAWIVKVVFEQYAAGVAMRETLARVNQCGAKRLRSDKPFNAASLIRILTNEVYVGDRLLQKSAPQNYLTKRPESTVGYKSYYLSDVHQPLIDRTLWEKSQARLERQKEEKVRGLHKRAGAHFLYGSIFCADCGAPYKRRTISADAGVYKAWNCSERQKGRKGNGCKNAVVKEDKLLLDIAAEMGMQQFDEECFCDGEYRVLVGANGIVLRSREAEAKVAG
jgi:DNA invertase Pin-like site-specific DNA recombinase